MQHIHYAIHDMDIVMVLLVKETVWKICSLDHGSMVLVQHCGWAAYLVGNGLNQHKDCGMLRL